jgi:hypothetical protein
VSVTWAIRSPYAVLQPLVSRYIGYEQHDVALSVHRGLPSRHVTLIISLQDPVRMSGRAGPVSVQGDQAHLSNSCPFFDREPPPEPPTA